MKHALYSPLRGVVRYAVGFLLLGLGIMDLVETVKLWLVLRDVQFGTQLLLLPAGLGVLVGTAAGLRFARGAVLVTICVTGFVLVAGLLAGVGDATLGAVAPGGRSRAALAIGGLALLAFEAGALAVIARELDDRSTR